MIYLRALLGLFFFCLVSWGLSSDKRRFPWRVVVFALALQLVLAGLTLGTDTGLRFFEAIAGLYRELIGKTAPGAELVFGKLATGGGDLGFILGFAGSGLPVIIFFSALMAVLYHLGIMQVLIWAMARVMSFLMGVSGAESMAVAANVFVGQTEAPLVVRPYISRMTQSELNALMTGGFATIAGSMMAVYVGLLGDEYGPHLLTASVMSAPAAFLVAKIMQPESEEPLTGGNVKLEIERTSSNLIEAAATGTTDGLKLWLNVIAMLIAFVSLVALIDWPLGWLGDALAVEGGLSLARVFGWVFAPVAWIMGVEGWSDCQLFGSLLGTKVAVNEFVAFDALTRMVPDAGSLVGSAAQATSAVGHVFASPRSAKMAAYALCGFANFGSIGIQLGGIPPLAPDRKGDITRLALRAMVGGAFASWMTATIAGAFLA